MMVKFGWKRSDQVTVYSHLTMKEIDDKTLILHGLRRKEEVLKSIVKIQICESCGSENAPVAIYCFKSRQALTSAIDEKTQQRIGQLEKRLQEAEMAWRNPDNQPLGHFIYLAVERLALKDNLSAEQRSELWKVAANPWSSVYEKMRPILEPEIERA